MQKTPLLRLASRRHFSSSRRANAVPSALLEKNADDVVLTLAVRTPMCKAHKGAFKDTTSDALLYKTLKGVKERCGFDVKEIQDIAVGKCRFCDRPREFNVSAGTCHPPSPVYEARAAALASGYPQETPVQAINRLCSSGLMAIRSVSDSIARGDIDVGLAVGYESMTKK